MVQKHCWPEVHKLQNRARHYNLAKPWLDTSLQRHLRHGHLRDISINFLYDLYGKKLFPIISAPNIFTRSRDVRQWNKTFKGGLVFGAQIFAIVFFTHLPNFPSLMKCYIPYESPYAKDSKSIHCLVLVAMVTMRGLWLAKHENGCN